MSIGAATTPVDQLGISSEVDNILCVRFPITLSSILTLCSVSKLTASEEIYMMLLSELEFYASGCYHVMHIDSICTMACVFGAFMYVLVYAEN